MQKAFDVVYTKQEGFFKGHEFIVKNTYEETHTVFAENEKEAKKAFSEETGFGEKRIKRVVESKGNSLGSMFPGLAALKNTLK